MAELDTERAEIYVKSAKIIQMKTRTRISRKRFISMRKASICVQSFWRGQSTTKGSDVI